MPLVRLHSNVWSIKHLYGAPKSIYLPSKNNLPLIHLNGYFAGIIVRANQLREPHVLLIYLCIPTSFSSSFAAGMDKKGITIGSIAPLLFSRAI